MCPVGGLAPVSPTDLERQRNEPENYISSLASVDISHLWPKMLDSDESWREEDRISRTVDLTRMLAGASW